MFFVVARCLRTSLALFDDVRFPFILLAWADGTKLCNMHMERLLAALRDTLPTFGAPDVERVSASGLLTQSRTAHKQAGGRPVGVVTREELCEDKVQISRMQASSSTAQSSHPSPFILFRPAARGPRARAPPLSGAASLAE